MLKERSCCGTFEGSPHRTTCAEIRKRQPTKQMTISFVPDRGYQINDGQRMVAIVPFTDEQAGRDAALLAASHDLLVALETFVSKYDAAPDCTLGAGLVNGDFFAARAALNRAKGTRT
jgi:hypothetical protein